MALPIDSQFLRKLERFEIVPLGTHRGGQIGHRRSPSRGSGLEFADHKEYSPGDDIRYIDWNVYAHLEELFIKIFELEEALPVYVLVDVSGSMSGGEPSKLAFAAQLAAAVSYVGLANQDHVRVSLFSDGLVTSSKVLRGKTGIYELLDMLDAQPSGVTSLTKALETFSSECRTSGVVFIISDFLDPQGVIQGVRLLAGRRFGLYAVHVLARQEAPVELTGDVEIEDLESRKLLRVALKRDTVEKFGEFFRGHIDSVRDQLRQYGVRYSRLYSDQPVDEILLKWFPKEGVFR